MKQEIKPDRMLGPTRLIPVTRMSLRQFSAVSCVHRWPSTHQSQGNGDETQEVLFKKELQSLIKYFCKEKLIQCLILDPNMVSHANLCSISISVLEDTLVDSSFFIRIIDFNAHWNQYIIHYILISFLLDLVLIYWSWFVTSKIFKSSWINLKS